MINRQGCYGRQRYADPSPLAASEPILSVDSDPVTSNTRRLAVGVLKLSRSPPHNVLNSELRILRMRFEVTSMRSGKPLPMKRRRRLRHPDELSTWTPLAEETLLIAHSLF